MQEKIQNDKQCQQSQELKHIGLLAGGIVHSFNNAIGVVRGYADLALRAASPSDDNFAYLEKIIKGADAAKELAGKMLIFTRQKKPEFKPIKIQSIIEEAINSFSMSLTSSVKVQQDIDPTCRSVLADTDQIQQVVVNLCNNAFDAISENGGTLKTILKEVDGGASSAEDYGHLNEGRYVKLTVSDTGHGMDENTLKRIYEPFFTTKKAGEGAGLGLTLVQEIVSGHMGKIIAESKPGKGTTIEIYLPLAGKDNVKKKE